MQKDFDLLEFSGTIVKQKIEYTEESHSWSSAVVLKTTRVKALGSSNPPSSALTTW